MKGMSVLCRAGALALVFAASSASAQEGEAIKSLLGSIGIIPKEKEPIIYNERAPLVLPPKMELRPPAPGGGAEARNRITTPPQRVDRQADDPRMTPDELRSFATKEVELQGDGLERRYLSDPPGGLLKAAGGAPLPRATRDPVPDGDPDSPAAFIRQQQKR
jgi:hypothetical protein